MNDVSGIVATGKPQVAVWAEEADKKRVDKLQQKSQEGTITKLENAELCTRKAVEALKILTSPQISYIASPKVDVEGTDATTDANKVTGNDIIQIAARQSKGLNKEFSMKILDLPAEKREIFYQKDKKGNYMLPTKVLNRLAHICYKLEPTPEGVMLETNDPNHAKYLMSKNVVTKDFSVDVVTIEKIGSSAALNTYDDGTCVHTIDSIIDLNGLYQTGETKSID